ncbi:hypothetical protein H6P81_000548 [Aristolochia fimbriata]|uniref:Uncharacterized protein n=1 Tax=Aristolochia fimbriata TaxID=158543 RepID=A0AAV7F702_ARIFI|nr:hypothetical protein H6P81_000548 [Aristolochia fimbriata]
MASRLQKGQRKERRDSYSRHSLSYAQGASSSKNKITLGKDTGHSRQREVNRRREEKMGKVCCSDSDDNMGLIGIVVALVIAMVLMILCQPRSRSRVSVYHCH